MDYGRSWFTVLDCKIQIRWIRSNVKEWLPPTADAHNCSEFISLRLPRTELCSGTGAHKFTQLWHALMKFLADLS